MDNVKMRGFMKLTRIDIALEKFFSQVNIERLTIERLPTTDILARVLAEDVVAESDLPGFDRSAVDGYALSSKETLSVKDESYNLRYPRYCGNWIIIQTCPREATGFKNCHWCAYA